MIKKISVGELLRNTPGAQVEHLIEGLDQLPLESNPFTIDPESKIKSLIIRIPDGVAFTIPHAEIKVEVDCDRCLKKYQQTVNINNVEQLYYTHKLEDEEDSDEHDYELISNKYQELDITDLLVDVIDLALPITLLCDELCGGIDYQKPTPSSGNPFDQLKNNT